MLPQGPFKTTQTNSSICASDVVTTYWEELSPGDALPSRRDINPVKFATALDFAFTLEKQPHAPAKFRMAGSHITDLMGMDVRGMPLPVLAKPNCKIQIQSLLNSAFDDGEATTFELHSTTSGAHLQITVLPLLDAHGATTRALGTVQGYDLVEGAVPDFDTLNHQPSSLMPSTIAKPRFTIREYSVGFAEAPAPAWGAKKDAHRSERPYLKLVHTR